jgi:hypothetical protein
VATSHPVREAILRQLGSHRDAATERLAQLGAPDAWKRNRSVEAIDGVIDVSRSGCRRPDLIDALERLAAVAAWGSLQTPTLAQRALEKVDTLDLEILILEAAEQRRADAAAGGKAAATSDARQEARANSLSARVAAAFKKDPKIGVPRLAAELHKPIDKSDEGRRNRSTLAQYLSRLRKSHKV